MMEKKRSVGMTAVGIIYIIVGLIGFLENLVLGLVYCATSREDPEIYLTISILVSGAFLILFASGILLLKLRPLGRKLILYLSPLLSIVMWFYLRSGPFLLRLIIVMRGGATFSQIDSFVYAIFDIIIPLSFLLFNLCYFTRPKVKEQFK